MENVSRKTSLKTSEKDEKLHSKTSGEDVEKFKMENENLKKEIERLLAVKTTLETSVEDVKKENLRLKTKLGETESEFSKLKNEHQK